MTQPTPTQGSPARGNVQALVDTIRGRIIRGQFAPGQRLKEEWLAAEFGVSRIPMREALRALASEGFVRSERYGGTFVATLDAEAAHDLLDVRAVLEPLAAAQAAMRCTPEHLETFRRLLDEGDRAFRERRPEDTRTVKGQLYEHLAVASGNSTLIALMRVVRFKIEWATSIELIEQIPEETRNLRAKLVREMVDAMADRDPARAATAVAAIIDATYASQGWRRVVDVRFEAASKSP
ncbi:GntR family transcriptional regulator [Frankia sp. Mgl5]|uniref:GntR family transcriptional regulator n=1 Tax=Frankiaceae TaxID=74712 RepID=UPI000DA4BD36|nr:MULTISPECIES: GntR family transcriptional regulator [Frankiaceae]MCK9928914.1 GntR family transcriptional regulator [Frankia sp. Mgl5]TCJ37752.1 GntR family transcriptional regulator [Parafrankia sp. BMG5.11]SQD96773.1 Transcriptional regulator, GntR family [Parafrankia sp. Ea1.12]